MTTPAEKLGLKLGNKIIYEGGEGSSYTHGTFKIGDTLEFIFDSRDNTPKFRNQLGQTAFFDIVGRKWSKVPLSPFFGKKYRVTPETSELLQKEVFKAGGTWTDGTTELWGFGKPYLFAEAHGSIGFGCCPDEFNQYKLPEATLEVVKTVIIKDVIPMKTEQQRKVRELEEKLEAHKATMKDLEEQIKGMKE